MLILVRTGLLRLGESFSLEMVDLTAAAFSYLFLFWFAIDLLTRPYPRWLWLRWLTVPLFLFWALVSWGVAQWGWLASPDWIPTSSSLARYMLGLPGGMLAAWGWFSHRKVFRDLGVPQLSTVCIGIGVAFALFSLLSGLVTPRAPFFPASALNYGSFLNAVGLPVQVFRTSVAMVLAYLIVLVLRIYDVEQRGRLDRAIEERYRAQYAAVLEERERIGREVHDGLAQVLGYLKMMARGVESRLIAGQVEPARVDLQEMARVADDAYSDAREVILGLRVSKYGSPGLVPALGEYVRRFSEQSGLQATLEVAQDWPGSLPASVEIQAIRIVQEALSNVRKHANAQKVTISFTAAGRIAEITVRDDGRGFEPETYLLGDGGHFGLQTMRERAQTVGGTLTVQSIPGQGTRVVIALPFDEATGPAGLLRIGAFGSKVLE